MTENISTSIKRKRIVERLECRICGSYASYSYFGVIACQSCGVFFKRNARNEEKLLKCAFHGSCEINPVTRSKCAYCRLKKCFQQGMIVEMIRGPRTNKNSLMKSNQIVKFRRINLLDRDISLLDKNQWILLTNLINNYNESNLMLLASQIKNQCQIFKTVNERILQNFVASIYETAGNSLRCNNDINHLLSDDRSILLHTAVDNLSCLISNFILYDSQLFNEKIFQNYVENAYGKLGMKQSRWATKFIQPDIILCKLSFALFMFSTNAKIFHRDIENEYTYIKDILNIQNQYVELIWKYLIYKYGYYETIQRFMRIIQWFLSVSVFMSYMHDLTIHVDNIQSLIEQTELTLILDDVDRIVQNN